MTWTSSTVLIRLVLSVALGCGLATRSAAQSLVTGESPARPLRVVPDHEPPVLLISAPDFDVEGRHRTEADSLVLSGSVEDGSGIARLLIGGEIATLEEGRFSRNVALSEGLNRVDLQADDVRGNTARRVLTIERIGSWGLGTAHQIPDSPVNPNALAVAIGIERYRSLPRAPFAENDARRFGEYARRALGVPADRIYLSVNEDATLGEMRKVFDPRGWLDRRVTEDADIYVFFSGHGFRNPELEDQAYLVPYEAEPLYRGMNYGLEELYEALGQLKARTVTVFIDACFSGFTRGREFLVSGARGPMAFDIRNSLESAELRYPNLLVFSAADNLQFGATNDAHGHGLFTYFLLRGLRGEADDTIGDGDHIVTADELFRFTQSRVRLAALDLGHDQTPVLSGRALDRALVRY